MSASLIPATIVTLYIIALFAVTAWARRLTIRDGGGMVAFLLAGRNLPFWIAAALLTGLAVGGVSTIGTAEWAYRNGISAGWYNAAWAAGAFVLGLGAARRYRRSVITTLPELFERHYGVGARILGVGGQLVIQIVITSLQYVAGGAILRALLPGVFSQFSGMLATALVFVGITLIGGFWAAGLTNVINVIVIYLGLILAAVLTVGEIGGFKQLAAALPQGHPAFHPFAMGPALIAAWFIVMITMVHSTQAVIQTGFAARNERHAAGSYLLAGFLIMPVGFLSALIGMTAAARYPGIIAAEALPRVVMDLPPIAAGIVLAGLWAADVSTASALLLGSATLVSNDIVKRFFAPNLSPSEDQRICRITVAVLSVLTFLLAILVESILKALLVGLTLTTAYTLIVLMTMFCPKLCRRSSASWTLATTMAALALWLVVPVLWKQGLPHPIYLTWSVSLVTFFLVALIDRRSITLSESD